MEKSNKIIQKTVSNYDKEKLTFIQLGEALTDFKLFREIFPSELKDRAETKIYCKPKVQKKNGALII
jgi:hypothetical protein